MRRDRHRRCGKGDETSRGPRPKPGRKYKIRPTFSLDEAKRVMRSLSAGGQPARPARPEESGRDAERNDVGLELGLIVMVHAIARLMGEDVHVQEAFRVTAGLPDRFGEVASSTALAEAGIGDASGMAGLGFFRWSRSVRTFVTPLRTDVVHADASMATRGEVRTIVIRIPSVRVRAPECHRLAEPFLERAGSRCLSSTQ